VVGLADSGASLAVAAIAVALAIGTLGATGLYGSWGIGPGDVDGTQPDNVENDSNFQEPGSSGPDGGGLLGSVRAGLDFLRSAAVYIGRIPGMLVGVGVPAPLAGAFGTIALLAVGWTIGRFIRGVL